MSTLIFSIDYNNNLNWSRTYRYGLYPLGSFIHSSSSVWYRLLGFYVTTIRRQNIIKDTSVNNDVYLVKIAAINVCLIKRETSCPNRRHRRK